MTIHRFTLFVDGPDLQDGERIDALFRSGCADALIGWSSSVQHLDFDREAASFEDAVLSAAANVETIEGVRALGIGDLADYG